MKNEWCEENPVGWFRLLKCPFAAIFKDFPFPVTFHIWCAYLLAHPIHLPSTGLSRSVILLCDLFLKMCSNVPNFHDLFKWESEAFDKSTSRLLCYANQNRSRSRHKIPNTESKSTPMKAISTHSSDTNNSWCRCDGVFRKKSHVRSKELDWRQLDIPWYWYLFR